MSAAPHDCVVCELAGELAEERAHSQKLQEQLDALTTAARDVLDYENTPTRAALSRLRAALGDKS